MSRCRFETLLVALLILVIWCDSGTLLAQGPMQFGLGGFRRWDVPIPEANPLPEPAPRPRRWTLYFPPDWRHPAITRPPVKVYLDPPYEVVDPFDRLRNPPPPAAQPVDADPPPADRPPPPQRTIPKPKVLELNPDTGRLEERTLRPVAPGQETASGPGPEAAASDPGANTPSPFRGLRRWDGNG